MQEYVPQSGSVQDETAASPFGPRLGRAVVLLTVAVATHLWLVRAPIRRSFGTARPVNISQAGLVAVPQPKRHAATTLDGAPAVRVQTEFISVSIPGDHRVTIPSEVPVATTGVMQVRAELPTSGPAHADTLISGPAALESHALPALPFDEPGPVPNEFVEHIPAAATLAAASRVEAAPLDASNAPVVPAVDRSAELRKDEETVLRVLNDYTRAFERLDVRAAKAVFPSVDDRALQRAFEQLDAQQL